MIFIIIMANCDQDDHNGHIKRFPNSQDRLGEVQSQRHQGVGQEKGHPQRVKVSKNCIIIAYSKPQTYRVHT